MPFIDKYTCQRYNNDNNTCPRKEVLLKLVNNLSSLRKEKGLNQTELGEKVGVSRQTISLIERGDYNPSVLVSLSLARVFEVNVEDIFRLEEINE